jgi:hypothetical protein
MCGVVLAVAVLGGCAGQPVDNARIWTLYAGPMDSPTLGELIRYRATFEDAFAGAREGLQQAGYELMEQSERGLVMSRQEAGRELQLDVVLEASDEGMLRSYEATLRVVDGAPLPAAASRQLRDEISNTLNPYIPKTYIYHDDCYSPTPKHYEPPPGVEVRD